MRKKTVFFMLIAMLLFSCGKETATEKRPAGEKAKAQYLYPKFKVAAYKDISLKQWAFTAAKGERLSAIKTLKNDEGAALTELLRADGVSAGYAESKYFAEGICVLTADNSALYAQPTMTSEIEARLDRGSVLFVIGEKEGWLNVYAGKIEREGKEKWVTSAWIKEGFERDETAVSDALRLERALGEFSSDEPDARAAGETTLRELSSSDSIFADLAINALHSGDGADGTY